MKRKLENYDWVVATLVFFGGLTTVSVVGMIYGYPQALWVWVLALFVSIESNSNKDCKEEE